MKAGDCPGVILDWLGAMADSSNIWMPLYVGDYLADTMELSTIEHGAYLLLLMAYWKNGGPISADDKRLAVICKMSLSEFSAIRSALKLFFLEENGQWKNKRADQEIAKWGFFKADKEFGAAVANFHKNGTPIPERYAERYAERALRRSPPPPPLPSPSQLPSPPKNNYLSPEGDLGSLKSKFEEARKNYPGTKRGADTEWNDFARKWGKEKSEIIPKLIPAIESQRKQKDLMDKNKVFVPQWKNFKTWVSQRCWEDEPPREIYVKDIR